MSDQSNGAFTEPFQRKGWMFKLFSYPNSENDFFCDHISTNKLLAKLWEQNQVVLASKNITVEWGWCRKLNFQILIFVSYF